MFGKRVPVEATCGTTLYTITLTSDLENVQADSEVLGLVLGSLTVE